MCCVWVRVLQAAFRFPQHSLCRFVASCLFHHAWRVVVCFHSVLTCVLWWSRFSCWWVSRRLFTHLYHFRCGWFMLYFVCVYGGHAFHVYGPGSYHCGLLTNCVLLYNICPWRTGVLGLLCFPDFSTWAIVVLMVHVVASIARGWLSLVRYKGP